MKDVSKKQILFAAMAVSIYAVIAHSFSDVSWWKAIGIAIGIYGICWMQKEIQALRSQIDHVATCFSIADAELVRVSAIVNDLEDRVSNLQQELSKVRSTSYFK